MAQLVKQFSSNVQSSENPLEGVEIELDGETFECKGRLSILKMSELASVAIDPGMADAAEAASIYRTLSLAFGPEYARLAAHVDEHETADETVIGILQYINEAVQANIERITARPTVPSSSSPGGLEGKAELPVRRISLSEGTVVIGDQGESPKEVVKATRQRKPKGQQTTVRRSG